MQTVELTAGTLEYRDEGSRDPDAPTVVLLHGLFMDGRLWDGVVDALGHDHRCVLPTLPLGAHRIPMKPGADLSLVGMARIVAEFLERLDLRDVVLVFNDWGAAQVMIAHGLTGRIGRLVLTSCEAFDNYPPGLPGKLVTIGMRGPGGIGFALRRLRFKPMRRLPLTFGWMTKRGVPDDLISAWLDAALAGKGPQRDVTRYGLSLPPKATLLEWAERQREFTRPVLIAWAKEDRVMPPEHGRRLAELYPDATHVEIPDSYVLIPIDQPAALAAHLRGWMERTAAGSPEAAAVSRD